MCGCHQGRAQSPRESGAKSVDAEREKGEVAEEEMPDRNSKSSLSIYKPGKEEWAKIFTVLDGPRLY